MTVMLGKTCKTEGCENEQLEKRRICAECRSAYNRAYQEANRERLVAKAKAYREANKESVRAQKMAYVDANRDKLKAYYRAYYEANKEKYAAYSKAYYEANGETLAARKRIKRVIERLDLEPLTAIDLDLPDTWDDEPEEAKPDFQPIEVDASELVSMANLDLDLD